MCRFFLVRWLKRCKCASNICTFLLLWQRCTLCIVSPAALTSEDETERPYSWDSIIRATVCNSPDFISVHVHYLEWIPKNTLAICAWSRVLEDRILGQVYGQLVGEFIWRMPWYYKGLYAFVSFVLAFLIRRFEQWCLALCRRVRDSCWTLCRRVRDSCCRTMKCRDTPTHWGTDQQLWRSVILARLSTVWQHSDWALMLGRLLVVRWWSPLSFWESNHITLLRIVGQVSTVFYWLLAIVRSCLNISKPN